MGAAAGVTEPSIANGPDEKGIAMLRTVRRTVLVTAVAAVLLVLPALPVGAAPPGSTPDSIVNWLLDRLPWQTLVLGRAGETSETAPIPETAPAAPLPANLGSDSDGLPGIDPDGLSEGEGLPGLDPNG